MIPDKFIEQYVANPDRRLVVTTDATGSYTKKLAVYQQIVDVTSSLGVGTIYLPDVGEAAGLEYSITAITGNTQTVTVTEKSSGNSYDFPTNASLNAAYDRVLYMSDGKRWWIISDQYT